MTTRYRYILKPRGKWSWDWKIEQHGKNGTYWFGVRNLWPNGEGHYEDIAGWKFGEARARQAAIRRIRKLRATEEKREDTIDRTKVVEV